MQDTPKKKKNRADKTEFLKRIFAVQGWIVEGIQPALIIRSIITSNWCESERQAYRMLKKARDLWTEVPEAELAQKRQLKVSELQQLKRSLKEGFKGTPAGIRAMVAIDKEIIMLEGLRKPTKVELAGPDGQPIQTEGSQVILYIPDNGRN